MKVVAIQHVKDSNEEAYPLMLTRVQGGFPSPADDYIESQLNLNDYVVKNKAATFFVRVEGDSMQNAGIFSGDILVVDRSLPALDNRIVVAIVDGEFTVKRLKKIRGTLQLVPENDDFETLAVSPESDFQVWGIVTFVVHKPL